MGKKKDMKVAVPVALHTTGFSAPSAAVDPILASLFASSSGPISLPEAKAQEGQAVTRRDSFPTQTVSEDEANSSTTTSAVEEVLDGGNQKDELDVQPRKRRKLHAGNDIESTYLNKLVREDAKEEAKRKKLETLDQSQSTKNQPEEDVTSSEDDSEDASDTNAEYSVSDTQENLPQHESFRGSDASLETEKVKCTVFLGNVSTSAIKSKSAKNTLLEHLRAAIKDLPRHEPEHKIESLRFRSTAFVGGAGPKRVAFVKGELMDETTKSTNAYVVYTTELAARRAAPKLNGTVVLDRHLRADSLVVPTKIDHKRCVFVGNLSFVDEETANPTLDDGAQHRPKAKVPADAEEGLWRTFSKVGKLESVRVVRDKETRIGKGFAYVQFFDENAVEAALLMNEKKFPPMLPRKLRVMRAKRTKQKSIGRSSGNSENARLPTKNQNLQHDRRINRGSKLGFRGAVKPRTKEGTAVEGHRASKSSREPSHLSKHRKRNAVKPTTRSSRRGAAFKAAGGKRAKK